MSPNDWETRSASVATYHSRTALDTRHGTIPIDRRAHCDNQYKVMRRGRRRRTRQRKQIRKMKDTHHTVGDERKDRVQCRLQVDWDVVQVLDCHLVLQ